MADDIARLAIRIDSLEAKVAEERLDDLAVTGGRTEKATDKVTSSFKRLVGPLAAVVSAGAGAMKLFGEARQVGIFEASLKTATGSVESAAVAFDQLEEFASTTPFLLEQSIDAFVKLKNLGLDPSERALTSYGNTAAAMGKDLNQFIEAVADASTNEFERLKEFGIKASQQGDNVAFTFRGVTTTIRKNSEEIQEYLLALGENEFAGAMADRMDTVDGAASNLQDTWDKLFRTINEKGVGQLIETGLRGATSALETFINLLEKLDDSQESVVDTTHKMTRAAIDYGQAQLSIERLRESLSKQEAAYEKAINSVTVARDTQIARYIEGVEDENNINGIKLAITRRFQGQIDKLTEAQSKSTALTVQNLEKEISKFDELKKTINEYALANEEATRVSFTGIQIELDPSKTDDLLEQRADKWTKYFERIEEQRVRAVERLEESLLNEEGRLEESFFRRLDIINNNVNDEEKAHRLRLQIAKEYADEMVEITQREEDLKSQIRWNAAQDAASIAVNIASIFKDQSKAAFNVFKAASIAEASINAYKAYNKALADPTIIGTGASYVAAGAALAAGLANVARIASMQQTSSSAGGGGGGSVSLPSPPSQPVQRPVQQQQSKFVIQIGNKTIEEVVVEGLGLAVDNDRAILETPDGQVVNVRTA